MTLRNIAKVYLRIEILTRNNVLQKRMLIASFRCGDRRIWKDMFIMCFLEQCFPTLVKRAVSQFISTHIFGARKPQKRLSFHQHSIFSKVGTQKVFLAIFLLVFENSTSIFILPSVSRKITHFLSL